MSYNSFQAMPTVQHGWHFTVIYWSELLIIAVVLEQEEALPALLIGWAYNILLECETNAETSLEGSHDLKLDTVDFNFSAIRAR